MGIFGGGQIRMCRLLSRCRMARVSTAPAFCHLLLPMRGSCPRIYEIALKKRGSGAGLCRSVLLVFPGTQVGGVCTSARTNSLFTTGKSLFRVPIRLGSGVGIRSRRLLVRGSLLNGSSDFSCIKSCCRSNSLVR